MFDPSVPYNDLPDLPPACELETVAILKRVNVTNKALAKLSESFRQIPNARIITTSIVLQEVKASSEIENIVTTQDELYKGYALQGDLFSMSPEVKELLRYREALNAGWKLASDRGIINSTVAIEINNALLGHQAGIRQTPTNLKNLRTSQIIYTPPLGRDLLVDKLDRLWSFLYREHELDPLIRMALLHYQFEAIHPFGDGNGRTGRILNILYLHSLDILTYPVLYTSLHIIRTKARYYQLLENVTRSQDWESWILYMLEVLESAANSTYGLISEMRALSDDFVRLIRTKHPRIPQVKALVEVLFSQPYSRMDFFVNAGLGTRKTVAGYLKQIEELGLIEPVKVGKHLLYANKPLYNLLERGSV